jgi:magnesium-transporting ATPase (P-type)
LIYFIRIYLTSIHKVKIDSNVMDSKSNFLFFSLLQISVLLVFNILIVSTYLISKNTMHNLGNWFLPFTITLLCLPTFFYFIDNYLDRS